MKDSLDTIYVKPTPSEYVYHIDSEVGEPHNYRELIQCLESMQEGDHLSLYINTFGGYLHTTIALLGHLRATKGHVHTYVTASWYDEEGSKCKHFAVSRYGLLESFALACAYREQKIKELNDLGYGYTENHGK